MSLSFIEEYASENPFTYRPRLVFELDVTKHYLIVKEQLDECYDLLTNENTSKMKKLWRFFRYNKNKIYKIFDELTKELNHKCSQDLLSSIPFIVSQLKLRQCNDYEVVIMLKMDYIFDNKSIKYNYAKDYEFRHLLRCNKSEILDILKKHHLSMNSNDLHFPPYKFICYFTK